MYLALINSRKVAYLMVMLLILASGSPFFKAYGTYFSIIMAFVLLVDLMRFPQLRYSCKEMWEYVLLMLMIFFCQYVIFGWNTIPGIVNFISKILFGSFIIITLGEQFKFYYLRVLYHLSLIGLFLFLLQTVLGVTFSLFDFGAGKSIVIYYVHHRDVWRNCGPFWEPGAYGCYLLFVLLFFINNLPLLYKRYRKECIVLFIALLTTQSTTAYLSFAALIFLYLAFQMRSWMKYVYIVLAIAVSAYVYSGVGFLEEKIKSQNELAVSANGQFNSTRMGTFLFDMYYFEKHPIIGSGLHSRTRYADHQYLVKLWSGGELAKGGNAFSDYLAKMGIAFYAVYFYFFYKTNQGVKRRNLLSFLVVFIMLLFGEPLFSYPIALSLPFIKLKRCI